MFAPGKVSQLTTRRRRRTLLSRRRRVFSSPSTCASSSAPPYWGEGSRKKKLSSPDVLPTRFFFTPCCPRGLKRKVADDSRSLALWASSFERKEKQKEARQARKIRSSSARSAFFSSSSRALATHLGVSLPHLPHFFGLSSSHFLPLGLSCSLSSFSCLSCRFSSSAPFLFPLSRLAKTESETGESSFSSFFCVDFSSRPFNHERRSSRAFLPVTPQPSRSNGKHSEQHEKSADVLSPCFPHSRFSAGRRRSRKRFLFPPSSFFSGRHLRSFFPAELPWAVLETKKAGGRNFFSDGSRKTSVRRRSGRTSSSQQTFRSSSEPLLKIFLSSSVSPPRRQDSFLSRVSRNISSAPSSSSSSADRSRGLCLFSLQKWRLPFLLLLPSVSFSSLSDNFFFPSSSPVSRGTAHGFASSLLISPFFFPRNLFFKLFPPASSLTCPSPPRCFSSSPHSPCRPCFSSTSVSLSSCFPLWSSSSLHRLYHSRAVASLVFRTSSFPRRPRPVFRSSSCTMPERSFELESGGRAFLSGQGKSLMSAKEKGRKDQEKEDGGREFTGRTTGCTYTSEVCTFSSEESPRSLPPALPSPGKDSSSSSSSSCFLPGISCIPTSSLLSYRLFPLSRPWSATTTSSLPLFSCSSPSALFPISSSSSSVNLSSSSSLRHEHSSPPHSALATSSSCSSSSSSAPPSLLPSCSSSPSQNHTSRPLSPPHCPSFSSSSSSSDNRLPFSNPQHRRFAHLRHRQHRLSAPLAGRTAAVATTACAAYCSSLLSSSSSPPEILALPREREVGREETMKQREDRGGQIGRSDLQREEEEEEDSGRRGKEEREEVETQQDSKRVPRTELIAEDVFRETSFTRKWSSRSQSLCGSPTPPSGARALLLPRAPCQPREQGLSLSRHRRRQESSSPVEKRLSSLDLSSRRSLPLLASLLASSCSSSFVDTTNTKKPSPQDHARTPRRASSSCSSAASSSSSPPSPFSSSSPCSPALPLSSSEVAETDTREEEEEEPSEQRREFSPSQEKQHEEEKKKKREEEDLPDEGVEDLPRNTPPPPSMRLRRVVVLDKLTRFELEMEQRLLLFREQRNNKKKNKNKKSMMPTTMMLQASASSPSFAPYPLKKTESAVPEDDGLKETKVFSSNSLTSTCETSSISRMTSDKILSSSPGFFAASPSSFCSHLPLSKHDPSLLFSSSSPSSSSPVLKAASLQTREGRPDDESLLRLRHRRPKSPQHSLSLSSCPSSLSPPTPSPSSSGSPSSPVASSFLPLRDDSQHPSPQELGREEEEEEEEDEEEEEEEEEISFVEYTRRVSDELRDQLPVAYATHVEHERSVKELVRQLEEDWGVHTTLVKARHFGRNLTETGKRLSIKKGSSSAFPPDAVIAAGGDGTLLEAASFISSLDEEELAGEKHEEDEEESCSGGSGRRRRRRSSSAGGKAEKEKKSGSKTLFSQDGIWLFGFNTDPLRSEGRLCLAYRPPRFHPKSDNHAVSHEESGGASGAEKTQTSTFSCPADLGREENPVESAEHPGGRSSRQVNLSVSEKKENSSPEEPRQEEAVSSLSRKGAAGHPSLGTARDERADRGRQKAKEEEEEGEVETTQKKKKKEKGEEGIHGTSGLEEEEGERCGEREGKREASESVEKKKKKATVREREGKEEEEDVQQETSLTAGGAGDGEERVAEETSLGEKEEEEKKKKKTEEKWRGTLRGLSETRAPLTSSRSCVDVRAGSDKKKDLPQDGDSRTKEQESRAKEAEEEKKKSVGSSVSDSSTLPSSSSSSTACVSLVLSADEAERSCFKIFSFHPKFSTPRTPSASSSSSSVALSSSSSSPSLLLSAGAKGRRDGSASGDEEQSVFEEAREEEKKKEERLRSETSRYVSSVLRYVMKGEALALCRQRIRVEVEYPECLEDQILQRMEQQRKNHTGLISLTALEREAFSSSSSSYASSSSAPCSSSLVSFSSSKPRKDREEAEDEERKDAKGLLKPRGADDRGTKSEEGRKKIVHKVLRVTALNDIFIGECDSSRTFYGEVSIDYGLPLKQKSSGFLAATGTGSSAWSYNMGRVRVEQIRAVADELFQSLNLPSKQLEGVDWEGLKERVNRQLLFHPSMPIMRYFVREPIENSIFSSGGLSAGIARRIEVKALSPDAMVAIDGLLSFPLPVGIKVTLHISPYDALWTVK